MTRFIELTQGEVSGKNEGKRILINVGHVQAVKETIPKDPSKDEGKLYTMLSEGETAIMFEHTHSYVKETYDEVVAKVKGEN